MTASARPNRDSTVVLNLAAYKFTFLTALQPRRERLQALTRHLELKGTILLSPEGINLFVAGHRKAIETLLATLSSDPEIGDLEVKESISDHQPFNRMLVRLKKEIIAFGIEGIDPLGKPTPRIKARQLKQWLDQGRPCRLLDVRNDYEVRLGSFENAVPIGLDHFRNFPSAVAQLPQEWKQEPVVTFCTGGIRCEKAGPFLEQAGFENVYQLDGGILKYFETCGQAHYLGDCFVFDKRTALDSELRETETTLCYACQNPLTVQEQQSPHYVPSESCPYCFETREQ